MSRQEKIGLKPIDTKITHAYIRFPTYTHTQIHIKEYTQMAKTQNAAGDMKSERFVLSGKMYYSHLHPDFPDTAYTPRWGMALSLDNDMQDVASSNGLTIKDATNIMDNPYVSLHKNVTKSDGGSNEAPVVLDAKKNVVPMDVLNRIGWGSDAKVLISKFWMAKWKKWGYALEKVQIINLVEYNNDDGLEEEDGFVASSESLADDNQLSLDL
jgi:hypothetical protein